MAKTDTEHPRAKEKVLPNGLRLILRGNSAMDCELKLVDVDGVEFPATRYFTGLELTCKGGLLYATFRCEVSEFDIDCEPEEVRVLFEEAGEGR